MPKSEFRPTRRSVVAAAALSVAAAGAGAARAAAGPVARAASSPAFRRFRLGDVDVTALSDADAMIDGPWPIVGEDRPREEVERLMVENLLPPARFRPGFTPVLIETGRQRVLIDAGNGEEGFVPRPAGGRLVEALRAAGVAPQQIDVVALTHCHIDHIGGLIEGGAAQFPNARYVVGAVEHAFWNDDARLDAEREGVAYKTAVLFRKALRPVADRISLVKSGDEIAPGVTALAAFGHTPGHLAFHVESAGRRLLVWGDCAHHEIASLAHPEWSALFDMDKEQGRATRARIYDKAATERLAVLGYHTSFPSLGYVARAGAGFWWIPETYQLAE